MTAQEGIEITRKAMIAGILTKDEIKILGSRETPKIEKVKILVNLQHQLEILEDLRQRMEANPEDWEIEDWEMED